MREAFFNPELVRKEGIDVFLNGLVTQNMQQIDIDIVEEVRSFLFNVHQFERLRDGDRFWYENDPAFSKQDVRRLKKTQLSDVIKRNTKIKQLPKNVFRT